MIMAPSPPSWPWSRQRDRGAARKASYLVLADELRDMIMSGMWKPSMRLPSEREMAEGTGLCPNTIKKALNELETERLIYKRQGVGSFVCSQISKEYYRYYNLLDDFSGPPLKLEPHQIECELMNLPPDVAKHLAHPDAASAGSGQPPQGFRVERSFLVGQQPGIWSVSWLAADLFPGLDVRLDSGHSGKPLYAVLEDGYNVPSLRRQELLSVREPGRHVGKVLGVPANRPLLCSEFIGYTYYDRPFEFRTTYLITDRYKMLRSQ